MLYVFLVDVGVMYTFEMKLAMESVQTLMSAIASMAGISVDKQVLLIFGGEALDPSDRVCNYSSAGTLSNLTRIQKDTSPIFLFSKSTIESSIPPSPSLNLGSEASLKEQAEISFKLPPTYETLVSRAQLASEFHHYALEIAHSCECLISEQKFQQQGWAAVVANLESISREFKDRSITVQQSYAEFLDARPRYLEMLASFEDLLPLLAEIPVLHCLLSSQHLQLNRPQLINGISLLDWISAQDNKNSLQDMVTQCMTAVEQFDQSVLDDVTAKISEVQDAITNDSMKEIKGLDDRLEGLQHLLQKVQELVQSQADMAQGFLQNQTRAQNIGDPSVLPDLCASHQKQLMILLKNHSQLRDIRRRSAKAKDELSVNLHTRLRWIMYVEKRVCDCDSTLIIYHENIRRIKRRLDILEQVSEAPKLYVISVAEVVRRRAFSSQFIKWANKLSESAVQAHAEETVKREEFTQQFGRHFLQAMFPGLDDRPPKFMDKPPKPFDSQLPIIMEIDLQQLQTVIPKLSEYLDSSPTNISMCDDTTSSTLFPLLKPQDVMPAGDQGESYAKESALVLSENRTFAMSVETSTQADWTIGGQDEREGTEGRGEGHRGSIDRGTDMSIMQDSVDKYAPLAVVPSDAEDAPKGYSSQSDTDSELMFKSAQEDYVNVNEADFQPSGEDEGGEQLLGDKQDEDPNTRDSSQTLTLTSSESQSIETSTQTNLSFDEKLTTSFPSEESNLQETRHAEGSLSGETSGYDENEAVQSLTERVKELEELLGNYKDEIGATRMRNERVQNLHTNLTGLLHNELADMKKELDKNKDLVLSCREKVSQETQDALWNVKLLVSENNHLVTELASERTKQEIQQITEQVNREFEQEKNDLIEGKTRMEFEKNVLEIELEKVTAVLEASETRHNEEVEKLSLTLEGFRVRFEEQHSTTMKLKENKTRSEEDQQTRFNTIIMRLKREKDQAMVLLNEKLKVLETELQEQKRQIQVLVQEKDVLERTKEQELRGFKEKEKELLSALSSTEHRLQEIQSAVEGREREFQSQIEKEKASALLLLEVERQMWEAERTKQEGTEVEGARSTSSDVPVENYLKRIQQLEVGNELLNKRLANQADAVSQAVLDFGEEEMNPVLIQAKQALQNKDEQIRTLQQQLSQQQQDSGATAASNSEKVTLKDFQSGDLILLVFDPRYENYLVFSTGPTLFFLHPDSMGSLDLATTGPKRRDWTLAQLIDKEYCQAKKAHNRFHVPVGTKFYRIQAKPWER